MLDDAFGRLNTEVAVDLGTANTRVFVRGRGLVCELPSVVAVEQSGGSRRVVAVGDDARRMLGRTPEHIQAVRPLRGGVIEDYALAQHLLEQGLRTAASGSSWRGLRMLVCVPQSTEEVARRAIQDAARAAGARQVELVAKSVAACVGAELPVQDPVGSLVVDMGAGITELALLSLGAPIVIETVRGGGAAVDEAIASWIQEQHQVMVGERTAETIKTQVAGALPLRDGLSLVVTGRDMSSGIPRELRVESEPLVPTIQAALQPIVEALKSLLAKASPELAADIAEQGIVLTGGAARLRDADRWLSETTGTPVVVAEHPERASVLGAGEMLGMGDATRRLRQAPGSAG